MENPKVAGTGPIKVSVEEGKSYAWCSCGESANQPFCDGKHKGTGFTPKMYTAEATKDVHFCACKQSDNPILCNGAHKSL